MRPGLGDNFWCQDLPVLPLRIYKSYNETSLIKTYGRLGH